MLDPRAIAVAGIGYGARAVATLGLWPISITPPVVEPTPPRKYSGRRARTLSAPVDDDDDALLISVLL